MNKTQIIALVAVVGLSFGLFAYLQKQRRKIETMDYEFENVKLTGINSQNITLSFDLVLENTSDLDLKVYDINFAVKWNNSKIGSVQTPRAYIVPKRSTHVVPLVLTINKEEAGAALQNAFSNLQNFLGGVIKIDGTMAVGADVFTIPRYPFEYEDTAANLVGYSISSIIR